MNWLGHLNRLGLLNRFANLICGSIKPVCSFDMVGPFEPVETFELIGSFEMVGPFEPVETFELFGSFDMVGHLNQSRHLNWLGHFIWLGHLNRLGQGGLAVRPGTELI